MKLFKFKKYFFPLLILNIEIPFIKIYTNFFQERMESDTFEYVFLYLEIFKWNFKFRLYNTSVRTRKIKNTNKVEIEISKQSIKKMTEFLDKAIKENTIDQGDTVTINGAEESDKFIFKIK